MSYYGPAGDKEETQGETGNFQNARRMLRLSNDKTLLQTLSIYIVNHLTRYLAHSHDLLRDDLFGEYFCEATVEYFSCTYWANSTIEVPEQYETGRGRWVVGGCRKNVKRVGYTSAKIVTSIIVRPLRGSADRS